jgi:formiminotetrahydrofolate cyclodeaminase
VAKALAIAARAGALENVHINLESIQDEAFKLAVTTRIQSLK